MTDDRVEFTIDELIDEIRRLKGPPGMPSKIEDPVKRAHVLRVVEDLYVMFQLGDPSP